MRLPAFSAAAIAMVLSAGSFAAEPDSKISDKSSTPQNAPDLRALLLDAGAVEARHDFAEARKSYERATVAFPDSAEAWTALGEHLRFYVHDLDAAAVAFQKVLSVTPADPRASAFAWRGLGEIEEKAGHDAAALADFQKSLEAQPLADTHRSLCHFYCRKKNFTAAAEHAGAAVKLNPDDAIARLLYATQLYRAGSTEAGRKEFRTALIDTGVNERGESSGPVHCCVLYNAAGFLSVCDDQPLALKMLQKFFDTPNHRHLTREEIETDADFENLKTTPAFIKMLNTNFSDAAVDNHK